MNNKTNKVALFMLMFNLFIVMGGIGLIVPVMPSYLETFNAGGQILGYLIGIFAFAQFIFSPVAGNMSDRYGRKPLILCGLIIYGISYIIFALAPNITISLLARFLSGLGAAFVVPPIMAYVADITTPTERGKGMGLLGAAISLGFAIGPGIGGVLSTINIVFPFYFAGICGLIASVLSYFILPNVQKARIATTAVQSRGNNVFVQIIQSTKTSYFMFLIIVFVFSFGIANFQATLALFLDAKFNYSSLTISIIIMAGGFAGVILQLFLVNKLFVKFGEMKIILINLITAAVSMLLVVYVSGFFLILTVSLIFSIATTFIRPAVNTLISKVAGQEQGFAAGMNNAYMSLGNMIGPILAGALFDWNINSPYFVGTLVLLLCFIMTSYWVRKKAASSAEQ